MTHTNKTVYRHATVKRLDAARVAKLGEIAFEGNFNPDTSSDVAIILYFAGKMADEGCESRDYSIELTTIHA